MYVLKSYEFQPDYSNIVKVASNQWVSRVPLYEHIIGANAVHTLGKNNAYDLMFSKDIKESCEGFRQYWDFWKSCGYDTASFECCIGGALIDGGALGGHKKGVIQTREDFEKYPFDAIPDLFFEQYGQIFKNLAETCPKGMKVIGGAGNGVFEVVQELVGYTDLCFMKIDDEELYADVFKAVGDLEFKIWDRLMNEYADAFCLMRFGDDLGFNTSTLLSCDDIREHILPQYRRITDKVHSTGRKFLLHSCGNLLDMFDDIIDIANIDAKHSNEDGIAHFSVWADRFGHRIGNFGGIDTDVVCRYSAKDIEDYVIDSLERVKGKGGIAFGSGNSIPDYVSVDGFVAMIETVKKWRFDNGKL